MNKPSVCVIMSTYNGESFLREQIESIIRQRDVKPSIFIRDDCSKDNTVSILNEYTSDFVTILKGENIGAKHSFLHALQKAPNADYYAFSDQDDVWDDNKLAIAISYIKKCEEKNENKPVLYCGRTRLVNSDLKFIQNGKSFPKKMPKWLCGEPLSAAGCTMVFNKRLKDIVASYMPETFPMHDAWVSNVCLAVGGTVLYDDVPHINYRQHSSNVVGGNRNFLTSIKRRILFYKKMGANYHLKMYREIINAYSALMPQSNIARCGMVCNYREKLRNKIKLITDRMFWHGSMKWKLETFLLILFNKY